jgi:hypothetical protein
MAGFKTESELIWGSPENDRFSECSGESFSDFVLTT